MAFNSDKYREQRYKTGGNSWKWSYWDNWVFKSEYINKFIEENNIKSAVEVGCGDGHNLTLYKVDKYIWLDVSAKSIEMCKQKHVDDKNKQFFLHTDKDSYDDYISDVSLCLDVTYHIFPRKKWEDVIQQVIGMWEKYVIFYSFLSPSGHANHINDYDFEEYITSVCEERKYNLFIDKDTRPPESQSRFVIITK